MEHVTQQYELYEAERSIDRGREFVDKDDLRIWLFDEVIDKPWFYQRWPHVKGIDVECNRRRDEGSVGGLLDGIAVMEFAPQHMAELFVLHELAHCCSTGPQVHDPIFARTYLELVFLTLGTEKWMALRTAFTNHNVCFDERSLYANDD